MMYSIEGQIKDILSRYPALQNKDKLNVLISLGGLHTALVDDLTQSGFATSVAPPESQLVYPPGKAITRDYMHNRIPTQEDLARAYIDVHFIRPVVANLGLEKVFSSTKVARFEYDACSQFGLDEIKAIFNQHHADMPEERIQFILDALTNKGVIKMTADGRYEY
jgi:hypothetical protein